MQKMFLANQKKKHVFLVYVYFNCINRNSWYINTRQNNNCIFSATCVVNMNNLCMNWYASIRAKNFVILIPFYRISFIHSKKKRSQRTLHFHPENISMHKAKMTLHYIPFAIVCKVCIGNIFKLKTWLFTVCGKNIFIYHIFRVIYLRLVDSYLFYQLYSADKIQMRIKSFILSLYCTILNIKRVIYLLLR